MPNSPIQHEPFIHETYHLARQAMEKGNHPFGALLVHLGKIISRAENTVMTAHDATRHAEMNLVSFASQHFTPDWLHQATLYTSTEPCAMCTGALYWTGIGRVVFGCSAAGLAQIVGNDFLNPCAPLLATGARRVEVIGPILQAEGIAIHRAYWPKQG
jgi:tRNA(Arg) A34 adenosine deaminase TadA